MMLRICSAGLLMGGLLLGYKSSKWKKQSSCLNTPRHNFSDRVSPTASERPQASDDGNGGNGRRNIRTRFFPFQFVRKINVEKTMFRNWEDFKVHAVSSAKNKPFGSDLPGEDNIVLQYKIGQVLGKGVYGTVYEAVHLTSGQKVAVKIVKKRKDNMNMHVNIPSHPNPLPLEIAMMITANTGPRCPNIIQLLDYQDNPEYYVIVMEYPEPYIALYEFQEQRRVLDEETARIIMKQVINAANTCFNRGVYHGDITPENLLVNPNTLDVKLIDFGVGKIFDDFPFLYGDVTGLYSSIQIGAKNQADFATVYTLGVLLFTMLLGHFPVYDEIRALSQSQFNKFPLSEECCRLLQDCLQENPNRRIHLKNMADHDFFKRDL